MRPYYYLGGKKGMTQLLSGEHFFVNTADEGITPWIIYGGVWEHFVDPIITGVIRPGDRFLDAGANQGYYSVKAGTAVGPDGLVVSFEPNPELFRFLESNMQINGFAGRSERHQLGLGAEPGSLDLTFSYANMGGGTVTAQSTSGDRTVTVEIVCGDDVLGEEARFDVMKFDIEGFEPEAAAGLKRVIERSADAAIIVEVTPGAWSAVGDFAEVLERFTLGNKTGFELCHDTFLEPLDLNDADVVKALSERPEAFYLLLLPPEHWALDFARSKCRGAQPAEEPVE